MENLHTRGYLNDSQLRYFVQLIDTQQYIDHAFYIRIRAAVKFDAKQELWRRALRACRLIGEKIASLNFLGTGESIIPFERVLLTDVYILLREIMLTTDSASRFIYFLIYTNKF